MHTSSNGEIHYLSEYILKYIYINCKMGWMCQSSQSTVVIILGQRDIFCLTNRKISTKFNIYGIY